MRETENEKKHEKKRTSCEGRDKETIIALGRFRRIAKGGRRGMSNKNSWEVMDVEEMSKMTRCRGRKKSKMVEEHKTGGWNSSGNWHDDPCSSKCEPFISEVGDSYNATCAKQEIKISDSGMLRVFLLFAKVVRIWTDPILFYFI